MTDTEDPARSLASRLRLAVMRLTRRLRSQGASSSVSLTQMSAISCLDKSGPLTPGDLAAREGVQPPSMTRVIAALEEIDLVNRRPHPRDGRQAIVELTTKGREYLAAEVSARERWLDVRLGELTAEERETLSRAADIIERMSSAG